MDFPLDVQRIRQTLPHRYPFLLVDRVLEQKKGIGPGRVGSTIRALKNVTIGEPHFNGHFPEKPIMPGVLIVEAMAQAGALAFFDENDSNIDVAIAGVNRAKFRKPVVPGDTLILEATVKKDRGQMVLIECWAKVEDVIVAEAEILAFVNSERIHRERS